MIGIDRDLERHLHEKGEEPDACDECGEAWDRSIDDVCDDCRATDKHAEDMIDRVKDEEGISNLKYL